MHVCIQSISIESAGGCGTHLQHHGNGIQAHSLLQQMIVYLIEQVQTKHAHARTQITHTHTHTQREAERGRGRKEKTRTRKRAKIFMISLSKPTISRQANTHTEKCFFHPQKQLGTAAKKLTCTKLSFINFCLRLMRSWAASLVQLT